MHYLSSLLLTTYFTKYTFTEVLLGIYVLSKLQKLAVLFLNSFVENELKLRVSSAGKRLADGKKRCSRETTCPNSSLARTGWFSKQSMD